MYVCIYSIIYVYRGTVTGDDINTIFRTTLPYIGTN